jgi:hypothetical protein
MSKQKILWTLFAITLTGAGFFFVVNDLEKNKTTEVLSVPNPPVQKEVVIPKAVSKSDTKEEVACRAEPVTVGFDKKEEGSFLVDSYKVNLGLGDGNGRWQADEVSAISANGASCILTLPGITDKEGLFRDSKGHVWINGGSGSLSVLEVFDLSTCKSLWKSNPIGGYTSVENGVLQLNEGTEPTTEDGEIVWHKSPVVLNENCLPVQKNNK